MPLGHISQTRITKLQGSKQIIYTKKRKGSKQLCYANTFVCHCVIQNSSILMPNKKFKKRKEKENPLYDL